MKYIETIEKSACSTWANYLQKSLFTIWSLFFLILLIPTAAADLFVTTDGLSVSSEEALVGQEITIYATVHNQGNDDLRGVVQFLHQNNNIGSDIPVTLVAGSSTKIFTKWTNIPYGAQKITARVIPWDNKTDDSSNNSASLELFIDRDTDGDGIPDRKDPDMDGDGVPNEEDAFPLDPKEWKDTDGDGIGDNTDPDIDGDGIPNEEERTRGLDPYNPDTDGDGVPDGEDAFPLDPTESKDSDGDGIGDNADPDNDNDGLPNADDPFPFNHGPIIQLNGPDSAKLDETLTYTSFGSTDPDGRIVSWEWKLQEEVISTTSQATITFTDGGTHSLTLTITDDTGESRTQTLTITVHQPPALLHIIILIVVSILILLIIIATIRFIHRLKHDEELATPQDKKDNTTQV